MSFLENMNNNPEFLNDFLKYSAYITFKSNLTVDEMYLDIRTFFRYLIFSKNENNVEFDINTFKTLDIITPLSILFISSDVKSTISLFQLPLIEVSLIVHPPILPLVAVRAPDISTEKGVVPS